MWISVHRAAVFSDLRHRLFFYFKNIPNQIWKFVLESISFKSYPDFRKPFGRFLILFWKHPFGSSRLLYVISSYEPFANLDFSFHATDALCHPRWHKGERRWAGWVETRAAAIRQHAGKLWWFSSHANYLIHRKEEKKEEKPRFQRSNTQPKH